jgi:hypothetical protein
MKEEATSKFFKVSNVRKNYKFLKFVPLKILKLRFEVFIPFQLRPLHCMIIEKTCCSVNAKYNRL